LSTNPSLVRQQLLKIEILPYQAGTKNFSIPDIVSNILLFIPFGGLVAGARLKVPIARSLCVNAALAGGLGLIFGLTIEAGQVFAPDRTCSLIDVMCNTLGAMVGGLFGSLIYRSGSNRSTEKILRIIRERPATALLTLLVFMLIADAFYPFEPTLDVSTVWENLKRIQCLSFSHGLGHFLSSPIVEEFFAFTAVGYLMYRSLFSSNPALPTALSAWTLTTLFVILLEGGKIFFVGRVPNVGNLLMGTMGAMLGVLLVPLIMTISIIRKYRFEFFIGLVLLLIIYSEIIPFSWAGSWDVVLARASEMEWLPIKSYFKADLSSVLFDLGKKILLFGSLGFTIFARSNSISAPFRKWIPVLWGLGIGLVFETFQLLLVLRTPSITDVLVFAASTWTGASLFTHYNRIVTLRQTISKPKSRGSPQTLSETIL